MIRFAQPLKPKDYEAEFEESLWEVTPTTVKATTQVISDIEDILYIARAHGMKACQRGPRTTLSWDITRVKLP